MHALTFKAGPGAFEYIRRNGFAAECIGTIAGASGGAKWLVLSQLDRVIVDKILPGLVGPVHLVGSSIGTWRFACYAQDAPLRAIERFEAAYLGQSYSERPDTDEISARSREILDVIMGDAGASQILNHPVLRTNVITVRARSVAASERPPVLAGSLILAATMNLFSRRSLGALFRRSIFYDARDRPPFIDVDSFPIDRIPLTEENLAPSILASGAIPLVLNGVRDIEGAPPGVYRDGGIIDYHLDLPTSSKNRLTLFPHFYDYLIPGWFDKRLTWRKPLPANVEHTLLVCPSREFVASLPNGKIPDRMDFQTMSPALRVKVWTSVVAACRQLADELNDVLEHDRLAARLEPL